MIKIVATCRVKADKIQELIELTRPLVEGSREEEGNISYGLHQDLQDKQSLAFIEFWKDEKSIEIHSQTPHFTTICPQINALCETEMTIHMYKEL